MRGSDILTYLDDGQNQKELTTETRTVLYRNFKKYIELLDRKQAQNFMKFVCGSIRIPPKFKIQVKYSKFFVLYFFL
jgi:hypothetical protein